MLQYLNIIKGNYRQYVRSYSFLVTIALSLFIAFGLIPAPDANYVTMKFGDFTGEYNSEWIGIVTALLSSIFLSLAGFFLISGSIKKDIDSRIGHIIGSTRISNSTYILTKVASNFLVLFTILTVIFVVSICLFFLYGKGFTFRHKEFLIPYAFIAIPSLFFVASFTVVLEVLFPKRTIIQYGIYLLVFFTTLFSSTVTDSTLSTDIFGIQYPTNNMASQIQDVHPNHDVQLTVGVVAGKVNPDNKVRIRSIDFPGNYISNRIFWMIFAIVLAFLSSLFFHRFDVKEKLRILKKSSESSPPKSANFQLSNLRQAIDFSPELTPLIKAEMTMLIRKNRKGLWIVTIMGMIAMLFTPLNVGHNYILPILWFLQVAVWSDLMSKDYTLRTYYFTAAAYKPLQRLFTSKVLSGISIALIIASPLILKAVMAFEFMVVVHIALGGAFIVLLAVFLGTLTKSKKLFEVAFFFIVYCNLNLVPVTDYYGAVHHSVQYTLFMTMLNIVLFSSAYLLKRRYDR